MTDRQIRCFLALYETLNFSAAARQLFLTQPTLSYQIRTLEEELGTPLFTRPCLQVLRQLTLAEHRRAVADGRL